MFGMYRGMGYCHGSGGGYCLGRGFGFGPWLDRPLSLQDEAAWLKRYRDHLQLRQKELEAELKAVEERIASLQK